MRLPTGKTGWRCFYGTVRLRFAGEFSHLIVFFGNLIDFCDALQYTFFLVPPYAAWRKGGNMENIILGIFFALAAGLLARLGVRRRKKLQKRCGNNVLRYTASTPMTVVKSDMEYVHSLFPRLYERKKQLAGTGQELLHMDAVRQAYLGI